MEKFTFKSLKAEHRNIRENLLNADKQNHLEKIVWEEFTGSIRLLIDNKYIFQPFWEYQRGNKTEEEWQDAFQKNQNQALWALGHSAD